jgi:hypothetical protein
MQNAQFINELASSTADQSEKLKKLKPKQVQQITQTQVEEIREAISKDDEQRERALNGSSGKKHRHDATTDLIEGLAVRVGLNESQKV